jgi:hypothetical protein
MPSTRDIDEAIRSCCPHPLLKILVLHLTVTTMHTPMDIPMTTVQSSKSILLHELGGLDLESGDFALKLGSILKSQQHYDEFVSALQGEERKTLIDLLDRVSLHLYCLAPASRCYY